MSQAVELVEVHLLSVPVDTWRRASAHQEAIERELEIVRANLDPDAVPNRLARLVEEYDRRFGAVADPTWEQLHAAAERGDEVADLTFVVPPAAAPAALEMGRMLDEVDDFCRSGEGLLSLATPPELVRFRQWFLEEFVRQIEKGLPPRSWEEYVADPEPSEDGGGSGDRVRFSGDLDLATAGALREEIQQRRASGSPHLTVDLTGVGFIDSVGISLLVTAHNTFQAEGHRVSFVMPARLKPLIELSGISDLLDVAFD